MRKLGWFLLGIVFAAATGIGALAVAHKVRTGEWSQPTPYDLMWMERKVRERDEPPRVIYLRRDPVVMRAGLDDSHDDRSSIVGNARLDAITLPGFSGTDARWRAIVKCVNDRFAPFDVAIVTERPRTAGYTTVIVGGRPQQLLLDARLTGIAPTRDDGPVYDAVAYVFADALGNRTQPVCETIAHEIGHVYGLDHTRTASDLMSYEATNGAKRFRDKAMKCGESDARACRTLSATQNSFQQLMNVLGPRRIPNV